MRKLIVITMSYLYLLGFSLINSDLKAYACTTDSLEIVAGMTDIEKLELLNIVNLEAGGESIDGQRMVIEVIFNRVLSDKFPNTVHEVLSEKHQFSTWKYVNSVLYNEKQEQAFNEFLENDELLPSKKYVYFDSRGGVNGRDHIKFGGHTFGRMR